MTDSPTSFARGVAIPFLLMGLLMTTVGAVVGYRSPAQVQALEQSLKTNPHAAVTEELTRMSKVNKAWPVYLAIWGLLGVAGLALRFLTSADLLHLLSEEPIPTPQHSMLWVECGQLRERMGALFENIAVRYDCLSDHSTCSHFRFGSKRHSGTTWQVLIPEPLAQRI
jgi:hypothetical protein